MHIFQFIVLTLCLHFQTLTHVTLLKPDPEAIIFAAAFHGVVCAVTLRHLEIRIHHNLKQWQHRIQMSQTRSLWPDELLLIFTHALLLCSFSTLAYTIILYMWCTFVYMCTTVHLFLVNLFTKSESTAGLLVLCREKLFSIATKCMEI